MLNENISYIVAGMIRHGDVSGIKYHLDQILFLNEIQFESIVLFYHRISSEQEEGDMLDDYPYKDNLKKIKKMITRQK